MCRANSETTKTIIDLRVTVVFHSRGLCTSCVLPRSDPWSLSVVVVVVVGGVVVGGVGVGVGVVGVFVFVFDVVVVVVF